MLPSHRDHLSTEITGVITRQERNDIGDLPGFGSSPLGLVADPLGDHLLGTDLVQVGMPRDGRSDRVDPHPRRGDLDAGAARQRHDTGFGRPGGTIRRSAARVPRKALVNVTARTRSQSLSVRSVILALPPKPALFTRTSTG